MLHINVFDLAVQEIMREKVSPLSFLQIGAHDGISLDPIFPYIQAFHWSGLLLEPQLDIFQRLLQNYANEPQLSFENAALAPYDGFIDLHRFVPGQSLPDHATMLSSFTQSSVSANSHGYRGETETIQVPAITLQSLFTKHNISQLDILQIDAEGFDLKILQMLHKTSLRPTLINFENAFYNSFDINECYSMLNNVGYKIAVVGIDTVAYLQNDNFPRKHYV